MALLEWAMQAARDAGLNTDDSVVAEHIRYAVGLVTDYPNQDADEALAEVLKVPVEEIRAAQHAV